MSYDTKVRLAEENAIDAGAEALNVEIVDVSGGVVYRFDIVFGRF